MVIEAAGEVTSVPTGLGGAFITTVPIEEEGSLTLRTYAIDRAGNEGPEVFSTIQHDPAPSYPRRLRITEPRRWAAVAGTLFPHPLEVIVTDENGDPVIDFPVMFEVIRGGGSVNNSVRTIALTTASGRATTGFQLGPAIGYATQIVRASIAGGIEDPLLFIIEGLVPRPGQATSVSGEVLDETSRAIPAASITLLREGHADLHITTDQSGHFDLQDVEPGRCHLVADSATSTLPLQRYPILTFEIDVYEGRSTPSACPSTCRVPRSSTSWPSTA